MDVKELMAFKPMTTPKRPAPGEIPKNPEDLIEEDPTDSYDARAKKRKLAMKKAQEVWLTLLSPRSLQMTQAN